MDLDTFMKLVGWNSAAQIRGHSNLSSRDLTHLYATSKSHVRPSYLMTVNSNAPHPLGLQERLNIKWCVTFSDKFT